MSSVVQKIINHKSKMKSRGIRNNNPLNIRRSTDRWEGARIEQTDKAFVQFTSMAYGYRAAWKTLESYWKYFHDLPKPFNVRNSTTHGERYRELHPHGAEAHGPRWQREHDATFASYGLRTLGIAHPCHDHDGVRHPLQGGGCSGHPRRIRPCFPRCAESEGADRFE